ncbi:protein of unknown function [Thauera humireducens]|nr:protein of unknown function [Thauera humireducens]
MAEQFGTVCPLWTISSAAGSLPGAPSVSQVDTDVSGGPFRVGGGVSWPIEAAELRTRVEL